MLYCFCMFVNKHFINTAVYISKSKRRYNAKPSAHYFYMRTKIPLNVRICISVPLRIQWRLIFANVTRYFWLRLLEKRLQDIFKTSSRRFEDSFKTSLRRLAKISSRRFQDVLSSYFVLVNTSLRIIQDISETVLFQRRLPAKGYALVTLLLTELWSVWKICKRDKNFSSFSLYYTF